MSFITGNILSDNCVVLQSNTANMFNLASNHDDNDVPKRFSLFRRFNISHTKTKTKRKLIHYHKIHKVC